MDRICSFVKKYGDILAYLFFGVLTTAVNFLVYVPLHNWAKLSAAVSNCLAWAVAVIFAFLTNKPFVFKSNDWSRSVVLPEFGKFAGSRVLSGLLETVLIALTVDWLKCNGILMKVITSVIVIVVNYAASRWIVFRGNRSK